MRRRAREILRSRTQHTVLRAHKLIAYVLFASILFHAILFMSWIPAYTAASAGRSRLDFVTAMRSELDDTESTWVYSSGPGGFMNAGEQVCIDLKSSKNKSAKASKSKSQLLEWYCARWDV